MKKLFHIFCDESIKRGEYYSNFYGGAVVENINYNQIESILIDKKESEILTSEIKWQKINKENYEHYIELMNTFFNQIESNLIKIRIMFTNNRFENHHLEKWHYENEYHLLYYQFIKHAFGLKYIDNKYVNNIHFYIDKMPDKKEKNREFKEYLYGLQHLPKFIDANIHFDYEQIREVNSKHHIIMQYLDVVLGAIAFKMNKRNLIKNSVTNRRGKRTIAKDKVYTYINNRIRKIYPNFNIGITTGLKDNYANIYEMPYRHWVFKGK